MQVSAIDSEKRSKQLIEGISVSPSPTKFGVTRFVFYDIRIVIHGDELSDSHTVISRSHQCGAQ